MLQHYILIKYQKSAGEEHIAEFRRRMLALRTSIAGYRTSGNWTRHLARRSQLGLDPDHALRFC